MSIPPTNTTGTAPKITFLRSLQGKLVIAFLSLSLIPVAIVSGITVWQMQTALTQSTLHAVELDTATTAKNIEVFLGQFLSDVLITASVPPIQGINRAQENNGVDPVSDDTTEVWVERLNQIYKGIAESRGFYQQIRYLDANGVEQVRVDYRNGKPLVISGEDLQDKSSKDYFTQAMTLGPNQVYVSPLNLNREQDQIETPHTPVIRFSTPVFDEAGMRRGVVVINVYANSFLKRLNAENGRAFLANQDGYYLKHSDASRTFGFDLGTEFNANNDFPESIAMLGSEESYVNIEPSLQSVVALRKIHVDPARPERYWLVIETLPEAEVLATVNNLQLVTLGLGIFTFIIVATVSLLVARSITRPLNAIVSVAEQVSAGNLAISHYPPNKGDEIGLLSDSFKSMIENLREQIQEMLEAINVLTASSGEISAVTSQLAAGAAQTASSVSETTATVAEVRQTVEISSQKAALVSQSTQKAVQISQAGEQATQDTGAEMERINVQMESIANSIVSLSQQSQTIREIIDSVNDLAEQSNLLAVNAAIEAAKAGEQGKGFAVVAQEIKSLAQQSKQATAQVRNILNEIQRATTSAVMTTEQGTKAVQEGMKQSAEAGGAIRQLAESIAQSAQAATQIVTSSHEQLFGVKQMVTAMESINAASDQNANSARQLEISAKDIEGLGNKLKEIVARYQV